MLANDINRSQSYIGDIESGRSYPNYVLLNQIAAACGVSLSFFENSALLDNKIDKFIKNQLEDIKDEEVYEIRKCLKSDAYTCINYLYENTENYTCDKDAKNDLVNCAKKLAKYFLKQPKISNFCGISIDKLSENDLSQFTDDFLTQLKLISYKYAK